MPPRKAPVKATASAKHTTSTSKATPATEPAPSTKQGSNRRRGQEPAEDDELVQDKDEEAVNPLQTGNDNVKQPFESFFPALNLSTCLQKLDKWPLACLKKALAQAKHPRRNCPPPEVTAAAAGLVRDREKVVFMLALIGGCQEGLIRKVL